ncbi:hypothetical protein SDC9_177353 [bioreactor metagenome]|uniref:Uncharacterized protein n=1 Tax=bioreactor metagenome TaxID=1076179 RepID=A0A645GVW6_9ZZZZ
MPSSIAHLDRVAQRVEERHRVRIRPALLVWIPRAVHREKRHLRHVNQRRHGLWLIERLLFLDKIINGIHTRFPFLLC